MALAKFILENDVFPAHFPLVFFLQNRVDQYGLGFLGHVDFVLHVIIQ